ncbi:MAG: DUF6377 domain-containing protein [Bacteroidota bacterium]|nr:DUF6377 domain-containing protein [Bacteroidota bacterium]
MNGIKSYFLLIFILGALNCFSKANQSDSLLTVLKSEIRNEHFYDRQKEEQIRMLKRQLSNISAASFNTQFELYSSVFEQYRSFRYDSAYVYANNMIRISKAYHNKPYVIRSTLLLGSILLNSGFYKEAFDQLEKIDTSGMSDDLKSDYHILRARLNAGIAEYDNDAVFSKAYRKTSEDDFKKAESAVPPNNFEKTISLAFDADSMKKKGLSPDFFFGYIMNHNLSPHKIAMVSTRISFAFTGEDKIRFLALAAINDIRSSTKETLAIFLLVQELFKINDSKDAYIFIQEAVKNAKFYGARGRQVQIESILPIIASKLLDEKQHERDKFLIGFLIFLIIAVLLFFMLFIYRRQILRIKADERIISEKNKELENVNEKLWESSRIKEEFIGLFFKSCSSYIETLEKIKRKIQHNIKLENYQQVNQVLNNVQIDRERTNLYETLDNIFLTLFPNFISSFNLLLREEDQVWPKAGETLNASLRIFALIRLGISELEIIAKILNYSVSTVYTYKVRIKSKALVSAEEFEKMVMEIKFTDGKYPG